MNRIFVSAILVICLFCLVGCDQVTKGIARHELGAGESIALIGGFVRLTYAENPGTFMGLGAELDDIWRWSIYIGSSVVVLISLVLVFLYADHLDRALTIGLLLILSGAVGNLADRFMNQGRVIDFIVLGLGGLHTGVFNVADVFITVGVVLFLVGSRQQAWRAT